MGLSTYTLLFYSRLFCTVLDPWTCSESTSIHRNRNPSRIRARPIPPCVSNPDTHAGRLRGEGKCCRKQTGAGGGGVYTVCLWRRPDPAGSRERASCRGGALAGRVIVPHAKAGRLRRGGGCRAQRMGSCRAGEWAVGKGRSPAGRRIVSLEKAGRW